MVWQHWSGRDVATFVETVCGLPQYGAAMAQINGGTLQVVGGWRADGAGMGAPKNDPTGV